MSENHATGKTKLAYALMTVFITSLSSAPHAEADAFDKIINKAGKQRMITQRALKDYAMAGMNMEVGNPAADLKALVVQFDSSLKELQALTMSSEVAKSLGKIEELWKPIKSTLQKAPAREKARNLQKDLDRLLEACDENTHLIAREANNQAGGIVDVAGRQRMLSQRMAALYMLKAWKIDDPRFQEKLAKSMEEFSAAQKLLEASPLTTEEIRTRLTRVKKAYAWFEMMGKSNSNRVIPSLINKSANSILADMDEVTTLYAQINK
ncbi:type IV pili methyl-accepting chemotaxis transducer N-terminal domain-containing protein [Thiolapillus sp.]